MTSDKGLLCWKCGKPTGIVGRVIRMDSCVECMADLRCCHGCKHFDPNSHLQCREHIATPVSNKEKNNFCDFFQPRDAIKQPGGVGESAGSKEDIKKKLNDLFRD